MKALSPTLTVIRSAGARRRDFRKGARNSLGRMVIGMLLAVASSVGATEAFDHQHTAYADILDRHVEWNPEGTATTVDYQSLKANPTELTQYLQRLSNVKMASFKEWSAEQQLAFLINAYNAFTLKLIVDHYPVDSIRDLGSFWRSPWEKRFFTLLGEKRHLDEVEHDMIREPGRYNEPRIHFAVNCASIGCPALRDEPFIAERLDRQLSDSTRRFLRDDSRNRYRKGRLEVSSIFKWYRDDFERGWNGIDSLEAFFLRYAQALNLTTEQKRQLQNRTIEYRFLEYDWRLNDSRGG